MYNLSLPIGGITDVSHYTQLYLINFVVLQIEPRVLHKLTNNIPWKLINIS